MAKAVDRQRGVALETGKNIKRSGLGLVLWSGWIVPLGGNAAAPAARIVDIAGDRGEHLDGALGLHAVVIGTGTARTDYAGWFCCRELNGNIGDLSSADAADLLRPFGSVLFQMRLQGGDLVWR